MGPRPRADSANAPGRSRGPANWTYAAMFRLAPDFVPLNFSKLQSIMISQSIAEFWYPKSQRSYHFHSFFLSLKCGRIKHKTNLLVFHLQSEENHGLPLRKGDGETDRWQLPKRGQSVLSFRWQEKDQLDDRSPWMCLWLSMLDSFPLDISLPEIK